MKYNFDKIINRKNSESLKWGIIKNLYKDDSIIPLWVADMDFEVAKPIQKALMKRVKHPIYGYPYRTEEYFESIINWYFRKYQLKIEKKNIFYSFGVVPAIYLSLLAFTKPEDKVIVQTPVYYPFFQSVENTKRKLIINRLKLEGQRYTIDFENLYSIVDKDTKALILCSPHNPVGRVWERDELNKLVEFCIEREILIISDEIHSDLILSDKKHIPTVMVSEKAKDYVITLSAPNKTFNIAGLTSGYAIIFNEDLGKKFQKTMETLGIGVPNLFSIPAFISAYNEGDEWLNQLIFYLKENYNYIKRRFEEIPKIKLFPIEATYLAWLDCRELNLTDEELFSFFLNEAKLLLNEGRQFGSGGEGFMRMNFATSRKILKEVMDRLLKAYEKTKNK
ncbi:MAG TPA: MalY/PatB family protein [Exilispira sp.]|nr:MalY/PatB family protein [Exilispira sp.]